MNIEFVRTGSCLTVRPEGRLDTASSPEFSRRMDPELNGVTELIIDLEKVDYLSSGGLRVLLATEQRMENSGGSMKLIHANEYIMEVFEMTGFLDLVRVE